MPISLQVRRLLIASLTIAFVSGCSAGSRSGIYLANLDGRAVELHVGTTGLPDWSPQGNLLAWGSEDGLVITSADGEPVRFLTRDPVAGRPSWSPDGSKIAILDEGTARLRVIDAVTGDSTMETSLAVEPAWAASVDFLTLGGPAWSPDGSRLAFVCWDGAGDEVCVIDATGNARRQVTKLEPVSSPGSDQPRWATATSNVGPPSWSPDGKHLAVAAYPERSGAPGGVFLIDDRAGTARQVSKALPNSEISWDKGGRSLIFSSTEKGRSDVIRLTVDGGTAEKLTSDLKSGARNPAVSPDGERIAVSSGGAITILCCDSAPTAIQLPGLKGSYPAWNASSDRIAILAIEDALKKYD